MSQFSKVNVFLFKSTVRVSSRSYKAILEERFVSDPLFAKTVTLHRLNPSLKGEGTNYKIHKGFVIEYQKPESIPQWRGDAAVFFSNPKINPRQGISTGYFVVLDISLRLNTGKTIQTKKAIHRVVGIAFGRGATPINSSLFVDDFSRKLQRKAGSKKRIKAMNTFVLDNGVFSLNTKSPGSKTIPTNVGIPIPGVTVVNGFSTTYVSGKDQIDVGGSNGLAIQGSFSDVYDQLSAIANFVRMYLDPSELEKLDNYGLIPVSSDEVKIDDDPLLQYLVTLIQTASNEKKISINIEPNIDILNLFDPSGNSGSEFEFSGIDLDKRPIQEGLDIVPILQAFVKQQLIRNSALDKRRLLRKLRSVKIRCGDEAHSLYQQLYFSSPDRDTDLIFFQGKWYRVPQTMLQKVQTALNRIKNDTPVKLTDFREWDTRDTKRNLGVPEHRYNWRMTKKNNAGRVPSILLDDPKRRYSLSPASPSQLSSNSKTEICDVMSYHQSKICLVHIKRGGAGEALSHLMGQLLASVVTMMSINVKQIAQLRQYFKLEGFKVSKQPFISKNYMFICGVIVKRRVKKLTDFSLLTQIQLAEAEQSLEKYGYRMHIVIISDKRS